MLKLLKKEFALCANPLSFVFLAFAAMVFIPSYPTLVGGFFVTLGIFYSFQSLAECNDILYTALLPIRKRDTVTAKFLFVTILQIAAFLLFSVCVCVRTFAMADSAVYSQQTLFPPNFAFLGFVLTVFALFNLIFVGGFFKSGYRIGKPFLLYSFAAFAFICAVEVLYHVPGTQKVSAVYPDDLSVSLLVLALGILLYVGVTIFSYRKACRDFANIDL